MKKLFLFGSLIASAVGLYAEPTDPPLLPPGSSETIYYGTEASTNPNNPCKGATTRICAKIITTNTIGDNGEIQEVKVVSDSNGKVISSTTTYIKTKETSK